MQREMQKAILAAAGRYIRRMFGDLEIRLKALESRPMPERGEPGLKGDSGERGPEGPPGQSVKASEVAQAILDVPSAREMLRGEQGLPGIDGKDGKDGENGRPGLDGKSVTLEEVRTYLDAELATWALGFERRAQDVLQRAIDRIPAPKDGRDGQDGKDGRDGLGVEDFDVSLDGRNLTVTVTRGDFTKSRILRIPALLDAGVFREGASYERGDGVTFGGSFWIAQKDAPDGKPGMSDDWRLAVKRGRDGKDYESAAVRIGRATGGPA